MFAFSSATYVLINIFLILTLGYLIGRIEIKGVGLGSAAVFLVALLFGHLHTAYPDTMFGVELPKLMQNLGLVFFVVSVGCMIAARPLVTKYINQKTVATNADRVLGGTARVTEAIDNTVPVGAVYVDGKTWSARSETDEPIAAGTMVRIKRMEGVRLFVEELKEDV